MKFIKEILNSFFIGVGIGATTFLLFIVFSFSKPEYLTSFTVLSVLFISGMVGILSVIFDLIDMPFLFLLLIHFTGTFVLMLLLMHLNNWVPWSDTLQFFLEFGFIYLIIWFYVKLKMSLTLRKANEKIQKRNKEKKRAN
ncbi:DUF3021 domain-containing protein [Ligilactobacillus sp. WILCCON 0076]|uniref:DUF3021 domain-containing protein n=1 Tax=Ligilactobacillus ubinensis TaxID=2876789 RepID=A0A9X2FI90_9LACO|nr:DUF3021 domain-containing protein [Ligilactobacillus ubinensis]MCP0886105.1 DUF3021 domain-containing protein [Ligilactobacillus ubinensis]